MKTRFWAAFAVIFAQISGLSVKPAIQYSDDAPIRFDLTAERLTIVQFADIHLTYGFDQNDLLTLKLIQDVTEHVNPDLVVFTGDQTLSITSLARYRQLTRHMETLNTPWTFIFGNHDYDFASRSQVLNAVYGENPTNLQFKTGPNLDDEAVGNFAVNYYYNNEPFYNLYFLDSKDELNKKTKDDLTRYKSFSAAQVNWYKTKALVDETNNIYSSVFMHIPLVQYREAVKPEQQVNLTGQLREHVYSQSRDTGFYAAMQEAGVSQAVFVGHDHRNNFVLNYDGILLAYGQSSGYNGYGGIRRGARIIEIGAKPDPLSANPITTSIIYEDLSYAA